MEQIDFPFIVKNKLVRIRGSGFNNALDKVLEKHPNKFVKTKFAKNMDLISAKQAAATESKKGSPIYVIIDKDGEADISKAPLSGVAHKFVNGIEDKSYDYKTAAAPIKVEKPTIPAQSEKAKKLITKKENVMKKETKKAASKKAAEPKAKPAKKVAAKIVGEKKTLSISKILEHMKKGDGVYRQSTGGKLSVVHMKAAKNKDNEIAVTVVKK